MAEDPNDGINATARAFTQWVANFEGFEARQILAGFGHLGNFLRAVSDADYDLEQGYPEPTTTEYLSESQAKEQLSEKPDSYAGSHRTGFDTSISDHSILSNVNVPASEIPQLEWFEVDDRAFEELFAGEEYQFLKQDFLRTAGMFPSPLLILQAL